MAVLVLVRSPLPRLRALLQRCWERLERGLWPGVFGGQSPPWEPALAVQGAALVPRGINDAGESSAEAPSLLGSVMWMAAPKQRRTIEVNRCRRRHPSKLIEIKRNIDVCPECGNLKQKHVLCGYCYAKVKEETRLIRMEIYKKEGRPFNAPTVETVVLYEGEKPTEADEGKRIIERARKRPSWFVQN
ncbi:39S ribosomal protein L32, mitochondrial [Lonchura striata]|uniref:Large ribosomal subunit protein bL32m n=1 Tax=Lonchura striata TaxID=40157 RepID=A0A218UNJ4_9PASE|nr:39S ribosomal protein L32, mitochondrial [Lonchura striata domestica]OWK55178.1 39S ribosomal protein L32, mitochondrial [Lonchura striata domestica]